MKRRARVKLSPQQRSELEDMLSPVGTGGLRASCARRMLSADGVRGSEIARRLDLTGEAVSRIRRRFKDEGIDGLIQRPKAGRKITPLPPKQRSRSCELALAPPPPGRSSWTTRLLAKEVRAHELGCISDLLRGTGSSRTWSRTYKVSRDPEFVGEGGGRRRPAT